LTERLAAAGGSLQAGPGRRGGFLVTAELPGDTTDSAKAAKPTHTVGRRTQGSREAEALPEAERVR
ncbi:hypothetical protein PBV88_53510, partial [Streptomyces sp. T21Q-yed]|nr:hypothetical protein [Streptomyces sp. T21Q-yed]